MESQTFSTQDFENKIKTFHYYIDEVTLKGSELSPEERRRKFIETLRYDEFNTKLRQIFDNNLEDSNIKLIFKKISINPDAEVEWSELFGYTSEDLSASSNFKNKNEDLTENQNKSDDPITEVQIFMTSFKFRIGEASGEKAKRDIIQSIYFAADMDSLITVAQKGAVSVWNNSKLKLQSCTFLKEQIDGWLNGCCFLPNIKRILITAERSLTIWDYRNNKNSKNLLGVQGMNALTCIDSVFKFSNHKDYDKVIVGDSFGHIMTFEINLNDLSSNNTKPDLIDPQKRIIDTEHFKNSLIKKKIHDDAVVKIKYIPELSCFISCSISDKISLVIEELNKFETKDGKILRQVGINKGLNTFCYCVNSNLIATGGVDKVIRLFNPLILNKTCAKLLGHMFTIVDLECNEKDQQLISLSSERVFRVWDLSTYKCLQIFSDTESRPGEKRIYCICFDQKRERLLTCSSVLDCWPLSRSVFDTMQVPHTHDRPIIDVCFSNNQIATLDSDSTLKVWESDTGNLIYTLKEVNGPSIEVVCMGLESYGYKLATGGIDGSIKIIDFSTGQELKFKPGFFNNKNVELQQKEPNSKLIYLDYIRSNDILYIVTCFTDAKIQIIQDSPDPNSFNLIGEFYSSRFDFMNEHSLLNKNPLKPIIQAAHPLQASINNSINATEPVFRRKSLVLNILKPIDTNIIKCCLSCPEKNLFIVANRDMLIYEIENFNPLKISSKETSEQFNLEKSSTSKSITTDPSSKINCILIVNYQIKKSISSNWKKDKNSASPRKSVTSLQGDDQPEEENSMENNEDKSESTFAEASLNEENNEKDDSQKDSSKESTDSSDTSNNYVIATGHSDSFIKFWDEKGSFLSEIILNADSVKNSPITAMCSSSNNLYVGDATGYITLWSLNEFLEKYELSKGITNGFTSDQNLISMIVCWKAHVNRIVTLKYMPLNSLILSGSADESVRIWWGTRGRFVGFLGQSKQLVIPTDDKLDWVPPYDITEPPIYSTRVNMEKKKPQEKNYQYPLIFDKAKLTLQKTPIEKASLEIETDYYSNMQNLLTNERYFNALVKPKHAQNEVETISRTISTDGSVFSSLPLYKESPLDSADFKTMLKSNPFRQKKEISFLVNEKNYVPKLNKNVLK